MKHIATFLAAMLFAVSGVEAKPLKVFILAGQSNMEGPANIATFDYIGDDPATAAMLKMMRGADSKPTVWDGAWISSTGCGATEKAEQTGKLKAGFGGATKDHRNRRDDFRILRELPGTQ